MPLVASLAGSVAFGRPQQQQAQLVTTNLQVWLDANSYTSGATWSNLGNAGTTYNFGLSNSPTTTSITYNGTTNTALTFNGVNQYAAPKTSLLTLAQANSWAETREYWVYWPGTAGCLTMESGAAQPDLSWFDAQASMSGNNLVFSVWQGLVSMTAYVVYSSLQSGAWNHIVWQHNKGTNTLIAYVNGTQTYSNAAVSRTTPDSVGAQFYPILMAGSATNFGYGSGSYLPGSLAVFRWYNSILSASQVQQNFNSERARFGR